MRNHVIALAGPKDAFTVTEPDAHVHVVPFDIPGHPLTVGNSTAREFAFNNLALSPATADLLRFAIAAYAADTSLPRKSTYDRWTRDIVLHLPVASPADWERGREDAVKLLQFLTGDHWDLVFRALPVGYAPTTDAAKPERSVRAETACLFSGGLDSFIGALDALSASTPVVLVGHHAKGTGATSGSQNAAITSLRRSYTDEQAPFLRFWVSPPKGPEHVSETTTRGRSLLFLGLGIAVASAAGAGRLIVPENGFISLNVPLTNSRLGTFSTRTTHPHYMALMRRLLAALQIDVAVDVPYRFHTKGEMVAECANQDLLRNGIPMTMSCSHPESNRFRAHDPTAHCGRCVPCLIRRAALNDIQDATKYVHVDLAAPLKGKSGSDLRATRLALDRYTTTPPSMADVLSAGPLPGTDEERADYVDVFNRGVDEVRTLLERHATA